MAYSFWKLAFTMQLLSLAHLLSIFVNFGKNLVQLLALRMVILVKPSSFVLLDCLNQLAKP